MSSYSLPYGKTTIQVTLPESVHTERLLPKTIQPFLDPHAAFVATLGNPVSSSKLETLARDAKGPVLIVCADQTRADGKDRMLPWLVDELESYGVSDDRITIIVAFGSHTFLPNEKLIELLGDISKRVRVIGHDINGPMVEIGTTKIGTPVRVNKILTQASLVITVSSVVHHYFAGYGGGRKMIIPGLASQETISANHSLIWEHPHDTSGGRHPRAKSGSLDWNPVHEDLIEAVNMTLKDIPNFSIVTVLSPEKEFGFFASGNIDQALRFAAKFADDHFMVKIEDKADVVIASAGGYPKDINMIQSHKGFDNAVRALKPGGTILYLMECQDGLGSKVVEKYSGMSFEEIRKHLASGYEVYGQTTHAIKEKTRDYHAIAISTLDPSMLRTLGFIPTADIEEAMGMLAEALCAAKKVYIIPRADITIPSV